MGFFLSTRTRRRNNPMSELPNGSSPVIEANNLKQPTKPLEAFEVLRAQRNTLAGRLYDLEGENFMLINAKQILEEQLAAVNEENEALKKIISEMSQSKQTE